MKFSKRFYWGTATSAHQVEGGIENNDWAEFARKGRVPAAGRACDFWNRYEYYLDLAEGLGTNAFRFSIEWARVEPKEGEWSEEALAGYVRMADAMRARGLEPFVTLWHFTLPQWVADKGGWANPATIGMFLRFAQKVAAVLGERVRYWIVINEPSGVLAQGYLRGTFPPGHMWAFRKYLAARRNLKRAVAEAAGMLRAANPAWSIGSAFNLSVVEAARRWNPADQIAAWLSRRFSDFEFISSVHRALDFIGLNYYARLRLRAYLLPKPTVRPFVPPGIAMSDLGWEIYPEGLQIILSDLAKCFGKPIIVTENGIADAADELRAEYIRLHLEALADAKARGADVRGYFHWSLIDNFEWAYGFGPRFGLFAMDYASMKVTERKSAAAYRALIAYYSSAR